jgi:hypothetical protein
MKSYRGYRNAVLILSLLLIIESVMLFYSWRKRPKKIIAPPIPIKGRIAIVIDDWGYNLNGLAIAGQIKYPLTVSVLPHLNYSSQVAGQLHQQGCQILLHLPLEPYEKFRLEQQTIMTSMDEKTIREIIKQDLINVPYVKGVSNHMGSKATQDLRIMTIVFKELKRRKLYFLDNIVSSKSACPDLARKMHLGLAKRDIFLDNKEDRLYIKGQIYKLKTLAKLRGQAIGVGHDRRVTLEVLKEIMPELEKEGYKFVFISDLIK